MLKRKDAEMTLKYRAFWTLLLASLMVFAVSLDAARVHKNMLSSRLAEVQLTSKADLRVIDEVGGIVDIVRGNIAEVYLLEEDFNQLRARGFSLRWIPDLKSESLKKLWDETRDGPDPLLEYHTNAEIEADFIAWQATYPNLFHYESVGLTVQGRNMWAAKVSDNVTADEPEIEVKYISTMHGNEPLGTEMCMYFIEDLLTGYGSDPELTELMENFEIWLIPMMNPDGNYNSTRYNANGVDLNRDFPDRVDDSVNTTAGRQIETAHVMNWSWAHNFVLSANFHTGALVVNYPWDNNYTHQDIYSPTPEDPLFIHLSLQYSQYNSPMYNNPSFPNGITNGADWYHILGGMQDWNYVWMGDKEVTIELSNTSWPNPSQLPQYWNDNRLSMRRYLIEAKYGVRGMVSDSATGDPLRANVQLGTYSYLTYSSALHGEYYRIFQNGTYALTFSSPGYESKAFPSVVVSGGVPTILNVPLKRAPSAVISTDPTAISEAIGICDSADVLFTIVNSGDLTMNWSAVENYVNGGGYGSAVGGGWRFIDSDQPGGPVYGWVDISGLGQQLSFASDDQNLGPYSIGFDFPFYGQRFSSIRVAANGWISFTSTATGETSWRNKYLPDNTAPENIIAAWWDDLSPHRTGTMVRLYTNNTDSLVLSFNNVQSYQDNGLYNFQTILLASGKIVFQYANMGTNRLNSSTIGLQNSNRTKGSTVIYNQLYIHNNMAIAYCPSSMVALVPVSGTVPAHSSQSVTARLKSCCVPTSVTEGILGISSNDPVTPLLEVPVTLDVTTAPPEPVTDLMILPEPPNVRLLWTAVAQADSYYVWRSEAYPVELTGGNFVGSVADTTYLDASVADSSAFYVITSVR
ncbi:MAG: M14 family zinc carboxypeptidase [bacterium]